MESEQKLLNAQQPFTDGSGTVHLPIALAMQLVAGARVAGAAEFAADEAAIRKRAGNSSAGNAGGAADPSERAHFASKPTDAEGKLAAAKQQ